ncbi:MAG: hypothetical protein ACK5MV_11090 [Aminipila sp.]
MKKVIAIFTLSGLAFLVYGCNFNEPINDNTGISYLKEYILNRKSLILLRL